MAGWALKEYPVWLLAVRKLTYIYMILIGMVVINTFIEAWHKIYLTLPVSQHRPIKGYVQVVKIFVIAITALIIISVVFRKEVSAVVAGLGAMAAVLMLIFKDPILGLVASIQLSVNKMMKIGDWISIPGRQVDGNVIDMTLTTVKVQNFDKSIITVPTYSLVSESFQNWIGMEESGVRQIKRSIMIDIRSISVAGKDLKEKYLAIPEISDFFDSIDKEYGIRKPVRDGSQDVTVSAGVTNLGLFRIYAETWLRKHPMIDSDQTIIVRHRPQAGDGLPLEIYAFCTRNSWIHYEHIQSEIFEHLFAVMPAFGLRVFQQPSGDDLLTLSEKK
jgi:miniconductance mechanosensitive channel